MSYNKQINAKHGKFIFNKNDIYLGESLNNYGEWSEGEIELIKQICKEGDIIIEVGSNIGAHSVPLTKLIGTKGILYGFETQKILFQYLCNNISLNNIKNAKIYNKAISDGKNEVLVPQLDLNKKNNFGGVSLLKSKHGDKIHTISLDEFLFDKIKINHNKLKLIKCDVEGYETKVVKGAKKLIEKFKSFLYLENDRTEKSKELIELVFNYGYKLYWHFVPMFNKNNYFENKDNIFPNLISFNMFGVHPSIRINLEEKWEKLEIKDANQHPLDKN